MRPRFSVLIALAALSAPALTAPAAHAAQRVLGPEDGILSTRPAPDKLEVRFSPGALAAAKLKAGDRVDAFCGRQPGAPPLAFSAPDQEDDDGGDHASGSGKVAAGGVVRITLRALNEVPAVLDGCTIDRVDDMDRTTSVTTTVAKVPLTPAGAVWAETSARAVALRDLIVRAHGANGYQPLAALGAGVVALAAPDASPAAPGQLGYWTDGAQATVAAVTAAGRHLVVQDLGGGMLRSNILSDADPFIVDEDELLSGDATGPSTKRPSTKRPDPEEDPGASPYTAQDPLTPSDGVHAAVRGQRLAVRFTGASAKAYRALAGRKIMVVCFTRPAPTLFPTLSFKGYGKPALARVARHGGRVVFTMKGAIGDACIVADDGQMVAVAAPTAVGKRWWHDLSAIMVLSAASLADALAGKGATSYPSTAEVVAAHPKRRFVALSGPGASPPVGCVGVWTDGARHAVMATRSATGRRLISEDEGDGMVRTNAFSELSGLWLLLALGDAGPS